MRERAVEREDDSRTAPQEGFFGHPRGLKTLFFAEMWERFSFYGMKPLIVLFLPLAVEEGGLGFDEARAGMVLAIYSSMVYLTNLPGGWIADRFLGLRRAVFLGGVIIMSGHICLAFHGLGFFTAGLMCVIAGTGLLKPNMTAMVGQLYKPVDPRRDSGFSIYYLGINTGAFLAPLVCGFLAQHVWFRELLSRVGMDPRSSWHFGFAAAAVGMFFGLVQFVRGRHMLGDIGLAPKRLDPLARARQRRTLGISALAVFAAAVLFVLAHRSGLIEISLAQVNGWLGATLAIIPFVFFTMLLLKGQFDAQEKNRLAVLATLFIFSALFFAALEQGSGTLNLFALRHTNNVIGGFEVPSAWYQFLNPLMIIVLTPLFAWLWLRLGNRQPSSPAKFSIALAVVGGSYLIMCYAALLANRTNMLVSPLWLIVVYFFITVAELCISPVGLSLVTRLAPQRVAGQVMGVWFLANALGNYLAGQGVVFTARFTQTQIFGFTAAINILAGVVLFLLVGRIQRSAAENESSS